MKKAKIIASVAASAALAALPAVGVFADATTETDKIKVDNLSVTVQDTCTLSRASTPHTNGDDGTTEKTATGTWSSNTLSGNIGGNKAIANFGKSHFSATCNHASGWTVDVDSDGLSNGATTPTVLSLSKNVAAAAGNEQFGVVATVGSGVSGVTAGTTTSATMITATGPNTAATFDVQYSVATKDTTPTGTYTGEVVYTLAEAS